MYSSLDMILGPFCPIWQKGNMGSIFWGQTALTYTKCTVVLTVCGGIPYVGVGLVYHCSNLHVGDIEDYTIFLKAFFVLCESSIDVAPSQAFFLRKR